MYCHSAVSSLKNAGTITRRVLPVICLMVLGCVEPYSPPLDKSALDVLSIDGFINVSDSTATVKLFHAQAMADASELIAESDAVVSIQLSIGESFFLSEQTPGKYVASGLVLDDDNLYTLHIQTKAGKHYSSDTVRLTRTPLIDSLTTAVSNDGEDLVIGVNAHDDSGHVQYFAWDYLETYEYHSYFDSPFSLVKGKAIVRSPQDQIHACWQTLSSTTISIGNTVNLARSVISHHPLISIPKISDKLSVRYHIRVTQRALSASEYHYLEQLLNVTEKLGSLSGPTPGYFAGNIHQDQDRFAPVLGYFSGGTVQQKARFVERSDLPKELDVAQPPDDCRYQFYILCDLSLPPGLESCSRLEDLASSDILISATQYTQVASCADCRTRGGITKKPDFW